MGKAFKNLTILALILLTSTLVITTLVTSSVKAQTAPNVYYYNSQGGNIDVNGTQVTPSTVVNYVNGDTIVLTPVPGTGFSFLCWDWISGSTPVTSTATTLTETVTSGQACAVQALFYPSTNATQTVTGSGSATVVALSTAGGTTSPASGSSTTTTSSYTDTIGQASTFAATASTGYKFLYWIVVSAQGRTDYTSSTVNVIIPASEMAIQAFFIPTASTVLAPGVTPTPTPKIAEYSSAIAALLVVALALGALGTYAYTKKARK